MISSPERWPEAEGDDVDLTFTPEQESMRDGLGRYLARAYAFDRRQQMLRVGEPWSGETWTHLAELGLTALPYAEEAGGLGGSPSDAVAVSELLGEHLSIEPYTFTVHLAGRILEATAKSGVRGRSTELLDQIIAGHAQVAFAYEEGRGTSDLSQIACTATKQDDGWLLNGRKELVFAAEHCAAIVVIARTDPASDERDAGPKTPMQGIAAFLVEPDANGMSARGYRALDGRVAASLDFDDVSAELLLRDAGAFVGQIVDEAVITLCAEASGAMKALLDQTVSYAITRNQFGKPIAGFQVIAHRLADMKMAYTKARASVLYTCALAESGRLDRSDVAVLKAQIGRLGRQIGEHAVQIHGGIGTTDELAIGHYLKRILTIEAIFGDSEHHLRTVGERAGA